MKLGKYEQKALDFAMRLLIEKGGDRNRSWHSFSKDPATKRPILSLKKKGLVEVYAPGNMFRITDYGTIVARQNSRKRGQTRTNPTRRGSRRRRELLAQFLGAEQADKIMEFGKRERREQRAFASARREIKRLEARGNPMRRTSAGAFMDSGMTFNDLAGNPSRRRLLEIEKELKKRARRMGLTGERARAYIYGTYGRIRRASGY